MMHMVPTLNYSHCSTAMKQTQNFKEATDTNAQKRNRNVPSAKANNAITSPCVLITRSTRQMSIAKKNGPGPLLHIPGPAVFKHGAFSICLFFQLAVDFCTGCELRRRRRRVGTPKYNKTNGLVMYYGIYVIENTAE